MSELISKNNKLENEMTLDMSYFWYSDDGRQNSIVIVTNWQELHINARSVVILYIRGIIYPPGTLPPLKLMETSLHLMLPLLSRKPATVGSLLSTLLKGQAGKIKKHTIPLTGWHVPGQENSCH